MYISRSFLEHMRAATRSRPALTSRSDLILRSLQTWKKFCNLMFQRRKTEKEPAQGFWIDTYNSVLEPIDNLDSDRKRMWYTPTNILLTSYIEYRVVRLRFEKRPTVLDVWVNLIRAAIYFDSIGGRERRTVPRSCYYRSGCDCLDQTG